MTKEAQAQPAQNSADPFEPRYIIDAIEIRGNDRTKAQVIKSYLSFDTNEVLNQELVELSRIRLLALGYFKKVSMSLEKGSHRGRVKVVVKVEERWPLIINDLFLGFSATTPVWGGMDLSYMNFLGMGMDLSGAFVASHDQYAFRLAAFWSSILGSNFSAGFEALVTKGREHALGDNIKPDYDDQGLEYPGCDHESDQYLPYFRAGGIASIGMKLDYHHRLYLDWRVEHIDAYDFDEPKRVLSSNDLCKNYPFLGYLRRGQSTLSSLAFRFVRDTRDNFFLPTQGMNLVISIELATKVPPLVSDYEYSKYMVLYEHNFNHWLDHVIRLTVMGGLIQDVREDASPFFTRFFIGDSALFQIDKVPLPRNLELNFTPHTDYGDLFGAIQAEYDVPLWFGGSFFYRGYAYFALNFSILTKADFLASEQEWSGRTKRPVSFDLGLKFETPIGLLTLRLGYAMDLIFK